MSDQHSRRRANVGQLVTALADERCRAVVSFFGDYSGDSASVETLACVLCDRGREGQERYAVRLHHVTLPALAETGVVDYDPETNVVHYHGHPEMERLEDVVPEL